MVKSVRLISSAGRMNVNEALVVVNIQGLRVGIPSRFRHGQLTWRCYSNNGLNYFLDTDNYQINEIIFWFMVYLYYILTNLIIHEE